MKSLIVIGPSGVGKGTIIKTLAQKHGVFQFVVSYTTRAKRQKQVEGQDYYFVDRSTFERKKSAGEMMEAKAVFSNWYGTSKQSYMGILDRGKIPLLDVDIEGMLDIKNSLKKREGSLKDAETEVLCILPPSWKVLSERLSKRGTENAEIVAKRMEQNKQQVEKMLSLREQNLHYVINYQYQLTVYGIELFLANKFPSFQQQYWNKGYANRISSVFSQRS